VLRFNLKNGFGLVVVWGRECDCVFVTVFLGRVCLLSYDALSMTSKIVVTSVEDFTIDLEDDGPPKITHKRKHDSDEDDGPPKKIQKHNNEDVEPPKKNQKTTQTYQKKHAKNRVK